MVRQSDEELKPRNGHTLMVGIVCRISGCQNQKELSLDDQEDNAKEWVVDRYIGPVEYDVIATKAKGERLDRPELEQIEAAYRSRKYDLFIYDDLSRLIRGGEAARLLGVGDDHDTRSVCLADGIDTIDPTWEEDALNACSENVAHNERTSKRIKQKCMNRFKKFGQPTGRPISAYIVPEGAESYDDWRKDESATPIIRQAKELLKATLDCYVVADFFNEHGFPVGPYARSERWDGPMVRRYFGNTLLKGKPQRGAKHTQKHHETGRRRSVKNPKGPYFYNAPHLAHMPEEEFDELNSLLLAANECYRRRRVNGTDPLLHRSRKDSRFPALHSQCWYCGWHHVWGANGLTDGLMCSNSRHWHCWHSIGFSGPEFVHKLVAETTRQLARLPQADEQFAAMVATAGTADEQQDARAWQQLQRDEGALAKQKANLSAVIKDVGPRPFLAEEIGRIEAQERELLLRRHQLERRRHRQINLPESPSILREMLEEEFRGLATESPAFGKLMQKLVPEIYVYSVRLCDGGHLLPRAKVKLNLAGTFPDLNVIAGLGELFTREVTFDLFEPPQRERIREEAVRLASTGLKPKVIAQNIPKKGEEKLTATAVQNALALHRKMLELGLDTPYIVVLEPPNNYPKLRRHKHRRYLFQPRVGYERPTL